MVCLSVTLLRYRTGCLWFCNKRFCKKRKGGRVRYLCWTLYFSLSGFSIIDNSFPPFIFVVDTNTDVPIFVWISYYDDVLQAVVLWLSFSFPIYWRHSRSEDSCPRRRKSSWFRGRVFKGLKHAKLRDVLKYNYVTSTVSFLKRRIFKT